MNNKEFLKQLSVLDMACIEDYGELKVYAPIETSESKLLGLTKRFIKKNSGIISRIKNSDEFLKHLEANKGKHEYYDKFFELFVAVALANDFDVTLNINTNKESDITLLDNKTEYHIDIKNKFRTFSQKNVIKKISILKNALEIAMQPVFDSGLNIIEFRIAPLMTENVSNYTFNLYTAIDFWVKKASEIVAILYKYPHHISSSEARKQKHIELRKFFKEGFIFDAELCCSDYKEIKNEAVFKNIEISQYQDIAKTVLSDFKKKRIVDCYIIFMQGRHFKDKLFRNGTGTLEAVISSNLIFKTAPTLQAIVYVDSYERIGRFNPRLMSNNTNNVYQTLSNSIRAFLSKNW